MLARRCFAHRTTATHQRCALPPLHRRTPVVRLITHLRQRADRWLVERLWPARATADGSPRRWTTLDGRTTLAIVDTAVSPLDAHRRNLRLVTDALTDAEVEHFVIPDAEGPRSRVGVPGDERTAALRALGGLAALSTTVAGGRPRRLRPRPGRRLRRAPVVRIFQPVTDAAGQLAYGDQAACDVEFWAADGDQLHAPRPNDFTATLSAEATPVRLSEAEIIAFAPDHGAGRYRSRTVFARRPASWPDFPVDLVCCWTDPTDPRWRLRQQRALAQLGAVVPRARRADRHRPAAGAARRAEAALPSGAPVGCVGSEELRHLLRSVHLNAPWIRRIFLITADQVPGWLDVDQPGLTVVDHRDLLGTHTALPTFNPYAVESAVHEIDGLAERFLYLPGNVYLGRPVTRATFFEANGIPRVLIDDEAGPANSPESAAVRRVFADQFDRLVAGTTPAGVPLALRRSTLAETCASAPELVARVRAHQLRQPDDVSLIRSLHHHWSFLRGTAVPGELDWRRIDPAGPGAAVRLRRLLDRRDADTFGLCTGALDDAALPGDVVDLPGSAAARLRGDFLASYFPTASPFEVDPEVAAARAPFTATELAHRLLRPLVGRFPASPQVRMSPAAEMFQPAHFDPEPLNPVPVPLPEPLPEPMPAEVTVLADKMLAPEAMMADALAARRCG
ncbi:hypothetical protein [Micromonospora sp. NBC_01813]|uniref:hypothetical protein n=1 Tax=Micromonospora sp. NBC_01813 TaxID=2975988 RepID=UPI002DDC0165|nr:hypothetical protein [Micromonospora sp. NBC_01813]WSA06162.1 hypothetical protein OG958_17665 [Micromonospora sp. NBC_01813]